MEGKGQAMSEYKTQCRLCKNPIDITIDDGEEEAAREVGLHIDKWIARGKVLCEPCRVYGETGHRPTNTPPMKDFLFSP
jgi:hypothetical protein